MNETPGPIRLTEDALDAWAAVVLNIAEKIAEEKAAERKTEATS